MTIYLDNSATTRQYDEVTDVMLKYMREAFGNPSSLYSIGLDAEKAVTKARKAVAGALSCSADEIVFTSGGTESDNTAIFGAARARKRTGNKIITTRIEHPAVRESVRRLSDEGFEIVELGVDENCRADMDAFKRELTEDVILVSVMHVNNETGTIQPVREIASLISDFNRRYRKKNTGVIFHVDAVQSFGKLKETGELASDGVDLISVSSHKIHGPKGAGALYIRKGLNIRPFSAGGGQENGMRSGTENVPAIAGFGRACEIMKETFDRRITNIRLARETLLKEIVKSIDGIRINGYEDGKYSCPSVLNISFSGTRGEVILHTLESAGIYVSTGSACSSHKKGSHVLSAMGCTDREIEGAIRFSFSEFNTPDEMVETAEQLEQAVRRFRKLGSFR